MKPLALATSRRRAVAAQPAVAARPAAAPAGGTAELVRKDDEIRDLRQRLDALTARTAEDLRLASRVQRSLLPPPLEHPRLDVAREFLPFREIGGDYYDFVPLGPNRLAFAIGDVMGKGIAAALLAASLKACVRAQLQAPSEGGGIDPAALVGRLNRLFWEITPAGLFATLFFAVLDLQGGRLDYVNAGHYYPFRVRANGVVDELVEGGSVLGVIERSRYERGRLMLDKDDVVVLYSDGISDRTDARGEAYGTDRLKEVVRNGREDSARIILYSVLGDLQGFSGGMAPEDDATLVVLKVR
jgi:phosphoserine phosphatase RsbU/P